MVISNTKKRGGCLKSNFGSAFFDFDFLGFGIRFSRDFIFETKTVHKIIGFQSMFDLNSKKSDNRPI